MSEQPDPVIQNIVDWCQEDNIQCNVDQNPPTELTWAVTLGRQGQIITIYKTQRFDDRIFIQSQIGFSPQHRTLVNQTMTALQRDNMLLNLRKLAVSFGSSLNYQLNNDEVLGINTFVIHHHSTIPKSELIEKYLKVESIHLVMLTQLNIELNVALQQQPNQNNTDTGR